MACVDEHHSKSRITHHITKLEPTREYTLKKTIGIGTFGSVFLVEDSKHREVAIKKVFLDPHFKNRELDMVIKLNHPNVLHYISHYITQEGSHQDKFLHLVTTYVPESLSKFIRQNPYPSPLFLKLFGFQIFSGLTYLHSHGVCHRDIKPQNVIVNHETGECQLCDFGSSKFLRRGEVSVSYISTRSYRAPELLLDCPSYTSAVDVWAAGCVLCEMVLQGHSLFEGPNNMGILNSITKVLGSPKQSDINCYEHKKNIQFITSIGPGIQAVLPKWIPEDFVNLMKGIFVYNPFERLTAAQCMSHPFFSELFFPGTTLPNKVPLPPYLSQMITPEEMLRNFPSGPVPPA